SMRRVVPRVAPFSPGPSPGRMPAAGPGRGGDQDLLFARPPVDLPAPVLGGLAAAGLVAALEALRRSSSAGGERAGGSASPKARPSRPSVGCET
ncbi:MAG: hypothetical protein ACRDZQ_13665, partial [Acidimicrobiales bacterium]